MDCKIITFLFIFAYEFLFEHIFAATILVGPNSVNTFESRRRTRYSNPANIRTSGKNVYVECGVLSLLFGHQESDLNFKPISNSIFSEIFIEYNDIPTESSIQLNIIFRERDIFTINNNTDKVLGFSYNDESIRDMEQYIEQLHDNIIFKVVKIYNRQHLSHDRPLLSMVFDNKTKALLGNLENLSVWNYVKTDLVQVGENNSIELQQYINNSTSYNVTVRSALKKAKVVINDRVYRYAFLLCVYAYEDVQELNTREYFWHIFKRAFEMLIKAEEKLGVKKKDNGTLQSDWDEMWSNRHATLMNSCIKDVIHGYAKLFLTTNEYASISLNESQDLLSNDTNTHVMPPWVLQQLFENFPKPQDYGVSYNFHIIPFERNSIQNRLLSIYQLIENEFRSFYC